MSWIISSLSQTAFSHIIGKDDSFSAWKAPGSAFGSISQNRQRQLHIELQSLIRNNLSVSEYLLEAKCLADELGAAGRIIVDADHLSQHQG